LRGFTGNPLDVAIRRPGGMAVTLNHADARLENVTVRDSVYNLVIQVYGGTASNCVLTAGAAQAWNYYAGGATLYNGLVTHCVITNNTHWGSHGYIAAGAYLFGGRLENSLVAGNTVTRSVDTFNGPSVGGVTAAGGWVVNCTIASNATRNHPTERGIVAGPPYGYGGVIATNGRVVNTVIAGNMCDDFAGHPDSAAWGVNSNAFVNCFTDTADPVNIHCKNAEAQDLYRSLDEKNYRPGPFSPAINAGADVSLHLPGYVPPGVDLDGNPRLIGRIDCGCYEARPRGTLFMIR